jgi:ketosteroid isomerase-like protein
MSEKNVELVRSTLAAFERAIASYWRTPRSMAEARGREQMAALLDDLLEIADAYEVSLTEIREGEGDLVYAAINRAITAKGSGIETTIPVFITFRIENGLIAQMDEYLDRQEALKAAGLRE